MARMYDYWLGGKDNYEADAPSADGRDPEGILAHPEIRGAGFDRGAPACVILACGLHFADAAAARDIVSRFAAPLAPGSYLIASVKFSRDTAFWPRSAPAERSSMIAGGIARRN